MGNFQILETDQKPPTAVRAENTQARIRYVNKHTQVIGMPMEAAYQAGLLCGKRDDETWAQGAEKIQAALTGGGITMETRPDAAAEAMGYLKEKGFTDEAAKELLELAAASDTAPSRPAMDLSKAMDVVDAMNSVRYFKGACPTEEEKEKFVSEHGAVIKGLIAKTQIGPLSTRNAEIPPVKKNPTRSTLKGKEVWENDPDHGTL